MPASMPLTVHEELDLLDEIERAMVRLTTAELARSEVGSNPAGAPLASPPATTRKTVIPAQAGPAPG